MSSDTGVDFDYSAVGSGGGIRQFANELIDVGSSTLVPTPIERNQMEEGLLMIPTAGGSVAIVYNLQNVTNDVKISREKAGENLHGGILVAGIKLVPVLPNLRDSSGSAF